MEDPESSGAYLGPYGMHVAPGAQVFIGGGVYINGEPVGSHGNPPAITTFEEIEEVEQYVCNFDSVELRARVGHAIIQQGDEFSVVIEAPRNLLEFIHTMISNGNMLQIQVTGNFGPNAPITFHITMPKLETVTAHGPVNITCVNIPCTKLTFDVIGNDTVVVEGIDAQELSLTARGNGNIRASGIVEKLTLKVVGNGSFNGTELHCQEYDGTALGNGSVTVWINERLFTHDGSRIRITKE